MFFSILIISLKEWKTSPGGQDDCWLYAIDFLQRKSFEFNDLYIYRVNLFIIFLSILFSQVRYSIPTRRQPIPRHTVSIYFTIDISKIKPKVKHSFRKKFLSNFFQQNHPVKVSFVFETQRLIHHPSNFRFRQNWLQNIVLLKENLSQGIDF